MNLIACRAQTLPRDAIVPCRHTGLLVFELTVFLFLFLFF